MGELLWVELVLGLSGVFLLIRGRWSRRLGGFTAGETVSLDDRLLVSERLGLSGRPDRLVRRGKVVIPEEWKSATRVTNAHRLQLGCYCLLVEEGFGIRPPFGVFVLGDGKRCRVKNSESLRAKVLEVADEIRHSKQRLEEVIMVRQPRAKCLACGQRGNCRQGGEILSQ